MAFSVTDAAQAASQSSLLTPQIVFEIDGVETLYGIVPIKKYTRIGDFVIGDLDIVIGGYTDLELQESLISFKETSNEISQTLNLDRGTNESLTTFSVALVDLNSKITRLITPAEVVADVLGRQCRIWLGFANTGWKDDYLIIFRGVIDTVEAKQGLVVFKISQDARKRSKAFIKGSTELNGAINDSVTTITVDSTTSFLSPYTGANGSVDTTIKLYVRIDDEIIRYTGTTGTTFTSMTRGQLGTVAAAHDDSATVDAFLVLEGNAIDLALKVMLSGRNGNYVTGVDVTNFVRIDGATTIANSIFFSLINLVQEYNVTAGDFITTTGASNGANNVTNKVITEVTQTDNGYYIVVDGVTFVEETGSAATISFRSQYDTLGDGLAMAPYEVDIAQHLDIQLKYISSADMRIYIKDTIENGMEFLAEQLYNPLSMFSIPRNAQSSVGIHQGPIPGSNIKTIDASNVTNAASLTVSRSINKNFFNGVVYKYDEDALEDKFNSGYVTIDGTSVTQIPVGNKPLIIDAKGFRTELSGLNLATQAASRRLTKYKFAAEFIKSVAVAFGSIGFDIEIGDKVIVDMASLKLSDINSATRSGAKRLFEVINKTLNISKAEVKLDLLDSNFGLTSRYSLIAPASIVKSGSSDTTFVLDPSYNTTRYGTAEYKKWINYVGCFVKIHSSDFSVSGTSYISSIAGNTITVSSSLGFTPVAGYIMELGDYDNQTDDVKLVYAAMSDGDNNFGDGNMPYQMS
jgi:hypothetical protein